MAHNAAAAPTALLLGITSTNQSLWLLARLQVGVSTCRDERENIGGGRTVISGLLSLGIVWWNNRGVWACWYEQQEVGGHGCGEAAVWVGWALIHQVRDDL